MNSSGFSWSVALIQITPYLTWLFWKKLRSDIIYLMNDQNP